MARQYKTNLLEAPYPIGCMSSSREILTMAFARQINDDDDLLLCDKYWKIDGSGQVM